MSSGHASGLRTRGVSTGTEGTKVNYLQHINEWLKFKGTELKLLNECAPVMLEM